MLQAAWSWADAREYALLSKPLFRLLMWGRTEPVLLPDRVVRDIERRKAVRRKARLHELGAKSLDELEKSREDIVSIGIFACNRFELLKRTVESLAEYLKEYGASFRHEVLLFHDGQNEEIETWAKENPVFDRIFFNPVNEGLSKNLNRFRFEASKGKYLLPLEDDWVCEYEDNFVLNALDVLSGNQDVGEVSLERRKPDDYQVWNKAEKIRGRVLSPTVYESPNRHPYRLLPRGAYGNSCALYRFPSLALVGRMRDDRVRRRAQEGEYMKKYNALWLGARGAEAKDSPFLHIGDGQSVPTWNQ